MFGEVVETLPQGAKIYIIKGLFLVARDTAGKSYIYTAQGWRPDILDGLSDKVDGATTEADFIKAVNNRLFTDEETTNPRNWADYRNKAEFLANVRPYLAPGGALSWYHIAGISNPNKAQTADEQARAAGFLGFSYFCMCYFKDQETADNLDALAVQQRGAIKALLLNDPAQFKKAIRMEMLNYEAPLSFGGEGYAQALDSCLGCKFDDLTPQYKEIFKQTAHEVAQACEW